MSEVDDIPYRNDEKRNILIRSIGMCQTKNFGISKYHTAIRRFLTAEVEVWSQVGYMVDKVALGKVSLLLLCLSTVSVLPRWFILTILLYVSNKYIHVLRECYFILHILYTVRYRTPYTSIFKCMVWCTGTCMDLKCTVSVTDSVAKSNTKEMASGDLYQRRSNFVL